MSGTISSTIPVTPLSSQSTDVLKKAANSATDNKKIDKAAQDFESILLGTWLQGAEDSFAKVPGTDDEEEDGSGGGGQFLAMGMQSLSASLAASGGIGIGKMIAKQLHKSEEAPAKPATIDTP